MHDIIIMSCGLNCITSTALIDQIIASDLRMVAKFAIILTKHCVISW